MVDGVADESERPRDRVSRREYLRATGALGGATALGGVSFVGRAAAQSASWTIVALPDTQKYAKSATRISYAHDQTEWVVANRDSENIVFVTHEGDVVEYGDQTIEWERMDAVMDRLDAVVPYAVTVGNHDYAAVSARSSGTENYSTYFGANRFGGYDWFGGSAPNDRGHYQRFSAGGYQFLHLDLEWGVPGTPSDPNTVMGWATDVLNSHPTVPTIITTHAYLWDKVGYEGHATRRDGANSGRQIYRYLVKPNPQVFMTFNGHYTFTDGQWSQVSTNSVGSNVYEMFANYQKYANGGDGWMRLVRFVPGGGASGTDRVEVRTYSPSRDEYKTDGRSQFEFDFSFSSRFGGV